MGSTLNSDGGAIVWRHDGSTYVEDATLQHPGGSEAYYGFRCDMSSDGNTILLSGNKDRYGGGRADIWTYDGASWSRVQELARPSSGEGIYGYSCSLSKDGKSAVVGGGAGANAGMAILWTLDEGTSTWSVTANLSKSAIGGGYAGTCALSSNGSVALVGGSTSGYIWQATVNTPQTILLDAYALQSETREEMEFTFTMNDPAASGISLASGTLSVGTTKAVAKLMLFAFTDVEPTEEEATLFYKNNLSALTASTDVVYVNSTGFALEQTVDLSTLGVNLTKAFNNLSGSASATVVDGGEYFVYGIVEDINSTVTVKPFVYLLLRVI